MRFGYVRFIGRVRSRPSLGKYVRSIGMGTDSLVLEVCPEYRYQGATIARSVSKYARLIVRVSGGRKYVRFIGTGGDSEGCGGGLEVCPVDR